MYQGHFATALLIKAICGPSIPAWPIMFGSSVLDLIGAFDGFIGLDILVPDSTAGPYMYTNFVFIDWEHSLLMMLTWSIIFGWVWCHTLCGFSKQAAMLGAVSSIVHWLMDVIVISPSGLTLYPHGNYHFGLGMYEKYPMGSWVGENVYCLIATLTAVHLTKKRSGADTSTTLFWILGLSVLMSTWLSPLLLVAHLYERGLLAGRLLSAVQMIGFWIAYIVPALALSRLVDREERQVKGWEKRFEQ